MSEPSSHATARSGVLERFALAVPISPAIFTPVTPSLTSYLQETRGIAEWPEDGAAAAPSTVDPWEIVYHLSEENLHLSEDEFFRRQQVALSGFELPSGEHSHPFDREGFQQCKDIALRGIQETGITPKEGLITPFIAINMYTKAKPYRVYSALGAVLKDLVLRGKASGYRRFKFLIDNLFFGMLQLPIPPVTSIFQGTIRKHQRLWELFFSHEWAERLLPQSQPKWGGPLPVVTVEEEEGEGGGEEVPFVKEERHFASFTSSSDLASVGMQYATHRPPKNPRVPMMPHLCNENFVDTTAEFPTFVTFEVSSNGSTDPASCFYKDIRPFSWYPDESEILILPGVQYVVEEMKVVPLVRPVREGELGKGGEGGEWPENLECLEVRVTVSLVQGLTNILKIV